MEDNFDFDKVGKRMPYKAPAGFFDKITESTLAEAERRSSIKKAAKWFSWPAMAVAASLVLLLAFGYVFYMNRTEKGNQVAIVDKPAKRTAPTEIAATTESIDALAPAVVPPVSEKAKEQATTESKETGTQAKPKAAQIATTDELESLDEVLANISDEELMLLAAVAETDLNVYEQTFE